MSLIQRGPGEELWTLADTLLENTWHKRDQYEFVALTAVEEIDNPPLQLRCEFTFTAIFRSYFVSIVFPGANAPYLSCFIWCSFSVVEMTQVRSLQGQHAGRRIEWQ